MHDEVRTFILGVITDVLNLPLPEDVGDDTSIGDDGLGLESLSIVELVVQVEYEYGISLPEEDLVPEKMATLGLFVDIVVERRRAMVEA
jgi:acyl carrier protein